MKSSGSWPISQQLSRPSMRFAQLSRRSFRDHAGQVRRRAQRRGDGLCGGGHCRLDGSLHLGPSGKKMAAKRGWIIMIYGFYMRIDQKPLVKDLVKDDH